MRKFVATAYTLFVLLPALAAAQQVESSPRANAPAPKSPDEQIEEIAARWVGRYDNHAQVRANLDRSGDLGPELTRERREMHVVRLAAPQLGRTVLYFEEFRASQPGTAHRQRVVSLVFDAKQQQVRAEQLFFRSGPAYDRQPLAPDAVAKMALTDFRRQPTCDLYFTWEAAYARYRGSMLPRTCIYEHEVDGWVHAEFDMLLGPTELWYRDRSIRIANNTIRGEIDGFSWLLFTRSTPPAVARHQGVYRGVFRRYDAAGKLTAEFPSEIIARVIDRDGQQVFHQTNTYSPANAPRQVIDSHGEIRDGRIWFANERLEGWSMDIPGDATGRGAIIVMNYKDGSGTYVYEIVTRSADGKRRSRATQYFKNGVLERRTLIDEEKVTDDWRAYEAARPKD
jgi:hypothetical protein